MSVRGRLVSKWGWDWVGGAGKLLRFSKFNWNFKTGGWTGSYCSNIRTIHCSIRISFKYSICMIKTVVYNCSTCGFHIRVIDRWTFLVPKPWTRMDMTGRTAILIISSIYQNCCVTLHDSKVQNPQAFIKNMSTCILHTSRYQITNTSWGDEVGKKKSP